MVTVINDPMMEELLINERQEKGLDKYDEVWEGVYMMSPIANNEHQWLVLKLAQAISNSCGPEDVVFPGVNVSDRDDWKYNYRVPDVAVYLKDNPAEDKETFMLGGPDLAVEILSPGDRTLEKLDFYASVNTKEVLIINRDPWQLDLYRHDGKILQHIGSINAESASTLETQSIPLKFRLEGIDGRPKFHITSDEETWTF